MKKSTPSFLPYANESDVLQLGGMTIENRIDRVSLHGDMDLTRDKAGLAQAKELHALLASVIRQLESGPLPDALPPPAVGTVPNPFD
jgi:hypothetical protein